MKIISEKQIRAMVRRANRAGAVTIEEMFLTKEQTEKGLQWLQKHKFDSELGYRERAVIEDFSYFTLWSLCQIGQRAYVPAYRVVAKNGDYFAYMYYGGQIRVIL